MLRVVLTGQVPVRRKPRTRMMAEDLVTPSEACKCLALNYSTEHFRYAISEVRKAIAHLIEQRQKTNQQIACVRVLKYMDVKLRHASFLAE